MNLPLIIQVSLTPAPSNLPAPPGPTLPVCLYEPSRPNNHLPASHPPVVCLHEHVVRSLQRVCVCMGAEAPALGGRRRSEWWHRG